MSELLVVLALMGVVLGSLALVVLIVWGAARYGRRLEEDRAWDENRRRDVADAARRIRDLAWSTSDPERVR